MPPETTPPDAMSARHVYELLEPKTTLALLAALVLSVLLVGRFAPAKRRRVAGSFFLFATSVVLGAVSALLAAAGLWVWADRVHAFAELFRIFTIISLAARLGFELALPRLSVDLPKIAQDVVVGLVYALACLGLFHRLGVNFSGILATSAVATAVVGLSLQPTLGNLVGGVALQMDGSIQVGAWVRLENKLEGRVREIRWRHTLLETRNGDTLIVPNGTLLGQQILVLGLRDDEPHPHRMWVWFDVDFEHPPERVTQVVAEALCAGPIAGVAAEPRPDCICAGFGQEGHDGLARYAVRYWLVDLARDDPTSSAIYARVHSALERAGIPLGVPRQNQYHTKQNEHWEERRAAAETSRRVALLDDLELFKSMTAAELAQLAPRLRKAPFSAGEVISRQGAQAHWLYILTAGTVEVRVSNGEGVEKVVRTLHAPSFFGEMSLMTGEPRAATVVAKTPVECFRLAPEDFEGLIVARPDMARDISEVLAKRRVELEAVRDDLDEGGRKSLEVVERGRIFHAIRGFFGLDEQA
ncbi:MAG TPA: mechanosensitive ion channel family protein [Polyangiaceae bacterium]|nr:mechanosensitive ion channel family protein [Polyangiaceae bacterium]